ncbi:RWD-domain-containing [Pyrrhoderma noxium]|uniref:RWD-domain-containing n=1 Tax=Pyrrhoderma noxium TaxID=2282107 RepID=A0A286UVX4_9AGAM|nr:RWD-domain-containing [Pyrrhoderma noxium]
MSNEVLEEEFQVLESIYPTELTKISDREIEIEVEPEEPIENAQELKCTFRVTYPESYPDVLPEFALEPSEGELDTDELDSLMEQLKIAGEENLGIAMTFTLVSHLRESLLVLVKSRVERQVKEEAEKARKELEEEEARTKGTHVTVESFKAWKARFDKEMAQKKAREEDERLKSLTPKEREEYKKLASRFSGKQLFERNRNLDDESLVEEGSVSVDVSQYERIHEREEEEEERLEFSDSD